MRFCKYKSGGISVLFEKHCNVKTLSPASVRVDSRAPKEAPGLTRLNSRVRIVLIRLYQSKMWMGKDASSGERNGGNPNPVMPPPPPHSIQQSRAYPRKNKKNCRIQFSRLDFCAAWG